MNEVKEIVLTPKMLEEINCLIKKLKVYFPRISTPNPNSDDEFEKFKKIEWVNQLKKINVRFAIEAVEKIVDRNLTDEIEQLVRNPLSELKRLSEMQAWVHEVESRPKVESHREVCGAERGLEIMKQNGVYRNENGRWVVDGVVL